MNGGRGEPILSPTGPTWARRQRSSRQHSAGDWRNRISIFIKRRHLAAAKTRGVPPDRVSCPSPLCQLKSPSLSVSLSCSNAKSNEPRHRPTQRCSPHGLDLPTRSRSSRPCSPHGPHFPRGLTSLRARSPHGPAVLMGSTCLGLDPPTRSQSPRPCSPHGRHVPTVSPYLVPYLLWLYGIM